MHIPLEYIMLTLVVICLLVNETLAAIPGQIPDDIPDLYCQGLIGLIGASCDLTRTRCVKTLPGFPPYITDHECSTTAIEATAAEYERLRRIALEYLHPSDSADSSRISHSLEIHQHISLSYFEFLRRAPPGSTTTWYRDIK